MAVPERRHGFTVRLQAWWQGQALPPEEASRAELESNGSAAIRRSQPPAGPPTRSPVKPRLAEEDVLLLTNPLVDPIWEAAPEEAGLIWPPARIRAAETIWGTDCLGPGNTDHAVDLAASFTLSPVVSFMEMNAGLGGATRAFVKAFGVWVTALERHATLAAEGQKRSVAAGMEKKAQIVNYNIDEIQFKARSFDYILAQDLFWSIKNKENLFSSIANVLKDHSGQIVFTDFLKVKLRRETGACKKWAELYPDEAHLSTHEEILDLLYRNRLDARTDEDISHVYRGVILETWQRFARDLVQQDQADRAVLRHIAREAERWTRFVAAIDAGELKVYRFHAAK